MTTDEYLDTPETNRPRELSYGVVREPPAPYFSHQEIVLRVARILCDHVDPRGLGRVAVAPLDVILDRDANLVVQPDVLFIATEHLSIIDKQIWGAPDLVVEVLSFSSLVHDRGAKLAWYLQYGVRECWHIDASRLRISVFDFTKRPMAERIVEGTTPLQSRVFPELHATPDEFFC
jgi:Uma2 family endonuclease